MAFFVPKAAIIGYNRLKTVGNGRSMGDERTWWTSLTFNGKDMGMNEDKRHYVLEIRERMEAL